jgi:hypothetical protein
LKMAEEVAAAPSFFWPEFCFDFSRSAPSFYF